MLCRSWMKAGSAASSPRNTGAAAVGGPASTSGEQPLPMSVRVGASGALGPELVASLVCYAKSGQYGFADAAASFEVQVDAFECLEINRSRILRKRGAQGSTVHQVRHFLENRML